MGKACVRFTKLEDVALDVLGEAIRRIPARNYVDFHTQAIAQMGKDPSGSTVAPARTEPPAVAAKPPAKQHAKPASKPHAKSPAKQPAKHAAKKPAAKKPAAHKPAARKHAAKKPAVKRAAAKRR